MFKKGYVFDDVLLVPKKTSLGSRTEAEIGVVLNGIGRLSVPIISANTQWCTETEMAIEMARMGGIGIVHRMCSIEAQEDYIRGVKQTPITQLEPGFAPTLDVQGRLKVGASIGIVDDYLERAARLIECEVDFLTVDIAHGHSTHAIAAISVSVRPSHLPSPAKPRHGVHLNLSGHQF